MTELQYLVSAAGKTKIVTVKEKAELSRKIIERFRIDSCAELELQYKNKDWGAWVDIDSCEELPDKAEIQVQVLKKVTVAETPFFLNNELFEGQSLCNNSSNNNNVRKPSAFGSNELLETSLGSSTSISKREEPPMCSNASISKREEPPMCSTSSTNPSKRDVPFCSNNTISKREVPSLCSISGITRQIPSLCHNNTSGKREISLCSKTSTGTRDIPLCSSPTNSTTEVPSLCSSSSTMVSTREIPLYKNAAITKREVPFMYNSTAASASEVPLCSNTTTGAREVSFLCNNTTGNIRVPSMCSSTSVSTRDVPSFINDDLLETPSFNDLLEAAALCSNTTSSREVPSASESSFMSSSYRPATSCKRALGFSYKFSTFGIQRAVREKLNRKEPLTERERGKVLEALYNEVTSIYNQVHYTSTEYRVMASAILNAFPHLLKEEEEENDDEARETWHKRIVNKFKNLRRRVDHEHPDVVAKRNLRRLRIQQKNGYSNNSHKYVWSLATPRRPEGETEDSISAHIKWMQAHARLDVTKQNTAKAELLMDLTFADRRNLIMVGAGVAEIKVHYPLLFSGEEFLREYYRIIKRNITDDLDEGLRMFATALTKVSNPKGNRKYKCDKQPVVNTIKTKLLYIRTEPERRYARQCLALTRLPELLGEPLNLLLVVKKINDYLADITTPLIVISTEDLLECKEFHVCVEKMRICTVASLVDAVKLVYVSYCVFNMAYPVELEATLQFVQEILVNLRDQASRKNNKMKDLLKKLRNLI